MAPRYYTRQAKSGSSFTSTSSHSTPKLLPKTRRTQEKVVKKQPLPKGHGTSEGGKRSRLAAIQAVQVVHTMTPSTRPRTQTIFSSDVILHSASKPLLACNTQARATREKSLKSYEVSEHWGVEKESNNDRLAAIEATNFSKEVTHIIAERARKTELGARRKGLKPPGTVRLSINRETLSVSWAVEIGDFGSSILFDSNNKKDAEAAGAIFAKAHKKDLEGISAASLAMIPITGSDDSDIDNSECLVPRTLKGYYYNAQN